MANGYILSKGAIQTFIKEVAGIIEDSKSILTILPREDKTEQYTTVYCLQQLEFAQKDIKDIIKALKVSDYVETCDDERNSKSNALYIFAIDIKNKQVYIKLKIQSYDEKIILCMSFHFVEFQINKFPYK